MPEKRPPIDDTNEETGLIGLGMLPGLSPVAAFNPKATENLLKTKGLVAHHLKHAPNPDRETPQGGVNPNTIAAKFARRFYSMRQLRVVPTQFKLDNRLNVQGIWGAGSVLLNVAGHYDDCDKGHAFFRPYDIVVIDRGADGAGITTLTDQLAVFNPNGPLVLNFRTTSVDYLADRDREYIDGQDFQVCDGKVVWLKGGNLPSFHDGKGAILTCVYWIKPIYIVQNVPHSIRITPGNDMGHGGVPREATYAPQLVVAKQAWFKIDNEELLDFSDVPQYNTYKDSGNVTGGSQ
jgi:hypothetical protein